MVLRITTRNLGMFDRRNVLGGAAVFGAALGVPGLAAATTSGPDGHAKLRAAVNKIADGTLDLSPAAATTLGLDKGARAALRARLDDRSPAAVARAASIAGEGVRDLAMISRVGLSGHDVTLYDTVQYALGLGREARGFDYGDRTSPLVGGAVPYAISQQNGAYAGVPEFLDSVHPIETRDDADAYLARLHGFARQLDQESATLTDDASRHVIAPSFVLDNAIGQMNTLRGTPTAQQKMVTSLARRTVAKRIAGDWAAQATRIVEAEVYPALDRQIAAATVVRTQADDRAGVWKLPRGDAYYAFALRAGTTTPLTPAAVHATGLAQSKELQARMDAVLRAQGLTQGSVGERASALTKDPRYIYPNTDAGRADLIAYVQSRIDAVRPLLPKMSKLALKADVQVKRVPVDIQDGAALGYMNFASLDGVRPAIYYINLKDNGVWPKWTLQTLTAHEGVPGHAYQGAYLAEHAAEIPTISSLMGFNAFVEGWALYSEQLVDELGIYDNDPLGRLGELQALNFRAARLVVDTGLHHLRWTRTQAIDWMVANTGRARAAVTSEVDRYCASPGQACGYKVGHNEILRLRAKAKAALGPKFDLRDFNDALLTTGGAPLAVLSPVIDRYIAGARWA